MNQDIHTSAFRSGDRVPIESLHAQHQKLVGPDRPSELRLRVARGLLPAAVEDLIPTICYLARDPSQAVRSAARQTLSSFPEDQLMPVVQATTNVAVIDTLARSLSVGSPMIPELAVNAHTHNATLVHLAGSGNRETCDVLGQSAARTLAHTPIIEALFFNPRASQSTVQNLLELAVRENVDLDHMPGFRETKAALFGNKRDRDESTGLGEVEFLSVMQASFDDGAKAEGKAEEKEEEGKNVSLQTAILSMSVAQKIRLAVTGDANARKLLIRDPKKMVSLAVLKSPRLTDGEVRKFAARKDLAEDVVTMIARNRAWTRDYTIRKYLTFNPKLPFSVAVGFLRALIEADVKKLSKDRDAQPMIRRAAKQILEKKEKAKKKKKK